MNRLRPAGAVLPWVPTTALVGSVIPANNRYYMTTFGGGRDAQNSACSWSSLGDPSIPRSPTSPSQAWCDGTWWYVADARRGGAGRWPCGTRLRISDPVTGKACVAIVADVGPGWFTDSSGRRRNVEQEAGGAVVDVSPLVARHLFGRPEFGYSNHKEVEAVVADPSTPVGPAGAVTGGSALTATALALIAMGIGSYFWLEHLGKTPRHNPRFGVQDARAAVRILDLKLGKIPIEELATGMNVEREHSGILGWKTNVTNGDPVLTAKIAWAHLKEHPDYYTRLRKAGLMDPSERVR